jgi:hypothetical protein
MYDTILITYVDCPRLYILGWAGSEVLQVKALWRFHCESLYHDALRAVQGLFMPSLKYRGKVTNYGAVIEGAGFVWLVFFASLRYF